MSVVLDVDGPSASGKTTLALLDRGERGPDLILYVQAAASTLRERKAGDPARRRGQHEMNLRLLPRQLAEYERLSELHPVTVQILDGEAGMDALLAECHRRVLCWRDHPAEPLLMSDLLAELLES